MFEYKGLKITNVDIIPSKYGDSNIFHLVARDNIEIGGISKAKGKKFCGRQMRRGIRKDEFSVEHFIEFGCVKCKKIIDQMVKNAQKQENSNSVLTIVNKIYGEKYVEYTNKDLLTSWKNDYLRDNKADKTIQKYTNIIDQLIRFTKKPLVDLTYNDIYEFTFADKENGEKTSKPTKRLKWHAVEAFYNWADVKDILVKGNPCKAKEKEILAFGSGETKIRRALTQDEIDRIAAYLKEYGATHDYLAFRLLLETGARVSGIMRLDLAQVEFDDDGASIGLHEKGDKWRKVYISIELAEELYDYVNQNNITKGYLFTDKNGRLFSETRLNTVFENVANKLGIEHFSPHTLRHTFGTEVWKNTRDLKMVKELLGHASITTTDIYTHVPEEDKKETMMKFAPRIGSTIDNQPTA